MPVPRDKLISHFGLPAVIAQMQALMTKHKLSIFFILTSYHDNTEHVFKKEVLMFGDQSFQSFEENRFMELREAFHTHPVYDLTGFQELTVENKQ